MVYSIILCVLFALPKIRTLVDQGFLFCAKKIQRLLQQTPSIPEEILLCATIQSGIRSGQSLDSILIRLSKDTSFPILLRKELFQLLDNKPEPTLLSHFLHHALITGAPVLDALHFIHRKFLQQQRLIKKAKSISGQARAQAEVLSILPWLLLLFIFLFDSEWAQLSTHYSMSWFAWSLCAFLIFLGRYWLKKQVSRCLLPSNNQEYLNEVILPELIIRIYSFISIGVDAESAFEKSLLLFSNKSIPRLLNNKGAHENNSFFQQLKFLLQNSTQGVPIKSELIALLDELQFHFDCRWEERVQQLPVFCLAPLFICFFPAILLSLIAAFYPLLMETL